MHLYVVVWGGTNGSGGNFYDIGVRLNGDSGNNYNSWRSGRLSDGSWDESVFGDITPTRPIRWGELGSRNTAAFLIPNYATST